LKLHADPLTSLNTVTAYGPGFVEINKVRHDTAVVLTPDTPVAAWDVGRFEALQPLHFEKLRALQPELVVLGTGRRQRFPHPRLTEPLTRDHVGVEAMDTPAACRTYNILMSEGRRVLAALLVED